MRGGLEDRRGSNAVTRDVPEESLMLTGDENIVDVDFSVFWVITNARTFCSIFKTRPARLKPLPKSTMLKLSGKMTFSRF